MFSCIFAFNLMKKLYILLAVLTLAFLPDMTLAHDHGKRRIEFIENKGQWKEGVLFHSQFHGGYAYFEKEKITWVIRDEEGIADYYGFKHHPEEYDPEKVDPDIQYHAYNMIFEGANPHVTVMPEEVLPDYVNYFRGKDRSRWASRVKKYLSIEYRDLYDGISARYEQHDDLMKYTFKVEPGADPSNIVMKYDDVDQIKIRKDQLIIKTAVQDIIEDKPYAYQIIKGDTVDIECYFSLEDNKVSFRLPKAYDRSYALYIDPTLVFSSFTGSVSDNWGYTATYDSEGYAYGGGVVFGPSYPLTTGAYDVSYNGNECDIVITKFDTTGSYLKYSTFIGGADTDVPHSLVCNSFDELLILGTTGSSNYPVSADAFDTTFSGGVPYVIPLQMPYPSGSDIVISKLSSDGTQLLASTYIGGSANDGLNTSSNLRYNYADEARGEIMVDESDNVYVASSTYSTDFPISGAGFEKTHQGGQDGVVLKMPGTLDGIFWSSFVGGSGDDAAYNIMVSEGSRVYIAGGTNSTDLPVPADAYQASYQGGSADGFIAYIENDGSSLLGCTYYGSSDYDQIYFVDEDIYGGLYVLGQTSATGSVFMHNAQWGQPGGGQFISQFSKYLKNLTLSTVFGNASTPGPDISPTSFMVDYCSNLYVAGWGGALNGFGGTSGLPVTGNAYQSTTDNDDYYFLVLDKDAAGIQYATFFGGTQNSGEHVDGGTSRFSKKGAIYQAICGGCGGFSDLPTTPGAWSTTNNSGNCNLALVKFRFSVKAVIADYKRPKSGCLPYTITFDNLSYSSGNKTYYLWDFGDGDTAMTFEPTHTFDSTGDYTITLKVVDSTTCNIVDSLQYSILVLDEINDTLPVVKTCKGDSVEIGIPPHNDPSVIYNWSPSIWIPGVPPVTFMPIGNISKSRTNVLPRNDTTFYLTINNGVCTDSIVQFVDVIDLEADAGPDLELCDSVINITAKGEGDSLMYIWSSNGNFTDTLNSNLTDSVLVCHAKNLNELYLKITDGMCEDIDTVGIDFKIDITDSVITPSCHGDSNGQIFASASGGNAPYEYYWSTGTTGSTISGLPGGDYTVTVTDSDSCIAVKDINLPDPQPLDNQNSITNVPCEEVCMGEIAASTSGGTQPYDYEWSDGQTAQTATNLCAGIYTVTISDDHACKMTDTAVVEDISVYFNFDAQAKKDTIFQGQSTVLFTTDTLNYMYDWQPANGLKNPTAASTVASPDGTTTYILTVTDQYGCTFVDTVTIHVLPVTCEEPYIFVPNAFTPDGDGKNDVLYVRSRYAEDIYFAVYNRWGEKVFETTDINKGWDGNIKGEKADQGVYVYRLKVICFTGEIFEKSGNVTLIR